MLSIKYFELYFLKCSINKSIIFFFFIILFIALIYIIKYIVAKNVQKNYTYIKN